MKIYKFGGASVKDANSVRNVVSILKKDNQKNILIVVSAMGKTTNALEKVVNSYFNDKSSLEENLQKVKDFQICKSRTTLELWATVLALGCDGSSFCS